MAEAPSDSQAEIVALGREGPGSNLAPFKQLKPLQFCWED